MGYASSIPDKIQSDVPVTYIRRLPNRTPQQPVKYADTIELDVRAVGIRLNSPATSPVTVFVSCSEGL
jgi:hypothetical protein